MTKETLKKYGIISLAIQQTRLQIEQIDSRLKSAYVNTAVHCNCNYYKQLIKLAAEISDLESFYLESLIALTEEQKEIEAGISCMPFREQILFRLKYIDGKTWEEIASIMNYSYQHIHRIHHAAIAKMEEENEGTG